MKLPKRFALSTLLLLMLVAASIFGYAQWRRQWLIRTIEELNDSGLTNSNFEVDDDSFWPHATPQFFVIRFVRNAQGQLVRDSKIYDDDELRSLFYALKDRYHPIGVTPLFQEFEQIEDGTQTRNIDFE